MTRLPLLVLLLFLFASCTLGSASAASGQLVAAFYRVIGNGNFNLHVAYIDPSTSNVTVGAMFANVYASYDNPAAFDQKKGVYYFPYNNYESSAATRLYVISTAAGPEPGFTFDNDTLALEFDPQSSTIFALTQVFNPVNGATNIVSIDPSTGKASVLRTLSLTQSDIGFYLPSSFNSARKTFSFIGSNASNRQTLFRYHANTDQLSQNPLACNSIVFLHFDELANAFYGIRLTQDQLQLVLLSIPSGQCKVAIPVIAGNSGPVTSAFDQQTGTLAILMRSAALVLIDTRSGNSVRVVQLPSLANNCVGMRWM